MGMLQDKVVMVTGAARGQGRAHAIASASEGADIILVDAVRQIETVPYPLAEPTDLEHTAKEVEALGRRAIQVVADVRSQADLDAAVQKGLEAFGKIDCLIANAGIFSMGSFWELDEQTWTDMIDVNLNGVWKCAKAVARHMIEREQGSIVITGSIDALEPGGGYTHYTAAKYGVIGLMKSVALELAPYGIRANCICPGFVDSGMTNNQPSYDMVAGHPGGTREEFVANGHHFTALKGVTAMEPSRMADTALYLNSALAARVTGVVIPVDAGHMLLSGHNHNPVR
ncbi:mycofactocin-coupled SDR family oxidoreductase [Rhodococcus koreensis]